MKLQPTANFVILRDTKKKEQKTDGGIVLPQGSQEKEHSEAEIYYRRAIDTGLADSLVHRNRGLNQMRQAKVDEAIGSFEESLKLNSRQPNILQLLADLHFQQQNYTHN